MAFTGINIKETDPERLKDNFIEMIQYLQNHSFKSFAGKFDSASDMAEKLNFMAEQAKNMVFKVDKDERRNNYNIAVASLKKYTEEPNQKAAGSGAAMYSIFKKAALDTEDMASRGIAIRKEAPTMGPSHYEDVPDEMLALLNDGDKTFRGSSDAYKEIQGDLKYLSDLFKNTIITSNSAALKYIKITFKAIIDKADKYIADRADTAMTASPNSYKGKRVRLMRQVRNILDGYIGGISTDLLNDDNEKYVAAIKSEAKINNGKVFRMTKRNVSEYKKLLENKLESGNFDARIYSEYRYLQKVIKDGYETDPVLGDCILLKDSEAEKMYNSNFVRMLKEGLKGKKVTVKQLGKINKRFNAFDKSVRDAATDTTEYRPFPQKYQKYLDYAESDKALNFLEGIRFDEENSLTGFEELDNIFAKYEKKVYVTNREKTPKSYFDEKARREAEQKGIVKKEDVKTENAGNDFSAFRNNSI